MTIDSEFNVPYKTLILVALLVVDEFIVVEAKERIVRIEVLVALGKVTISTKA